MVRRGPGGRFCVLNRRNYTRNGHVWNPMPDMELESLSGGFVFLEGGFAKRGVRTNPPNPPPPWLRACKNYLFLPKCLPCCIKADSIIIIMRRCNYKVTWWPLRQRPIGLCMGLPCLLYFTNYLIVSNIIMYM